MNKTIKYLLVIPAIFMAGIFFSCRNDMKVVEEISFVDESASEDFDNIDITFTKKGKLTGILKAEKLKRFDKDEPYIEVQDSLIMIFYDDEGSVESQLSSRYGIYYQNDNLMEFKENVIFKSFKENQALYTEHLFWQQGVEGDSGKLYTPEGEFVRITQKDWIIRGYGLQANENFSSFELNKVKGRIPVSNDTL